MINLVKRCLGSLIPALLLILANYFLPIPFSIYLLVCVLAALWAFIKPNQGKITAAWSVVLTASVLVTLNYISPKVSGDVAPYNNADYHVLALKGLDTPDSLVVVNSRDSKTALLDNEKYDGQITVKKHGKEECLAIFQMNSQPVFVSEKVGEYALRNKNQLISFTHTLEIRSSDSTRNESMTITFEESEPELFKSDTLAVKITTFYNNAYHVLTPSYKTKIKTGYPVADIIYSCPEGDSLKNVYGNILKDAYFVREWLHEDLSVKAAPITQSPVYMTIPDVSKGSLVFVCDSIPATFATTADTLSLCPEQRLVVGVGMQKSVALKFEPQQEGNGVQMSYDMPLMRPFPNDSVVNRFHSLAVSTRSETLLQSDVKEAFFFDIFANEENRNNFFGQISYQAAAYPNALSGSFTDFHTEQQAEDNNDLRVNGTNKLCAKNGNVWRISCVNLREYNPVTSAHVPWYLSDYANIAWIMILALFALLVFVLMRSDERIFAHKANGVMMVWMFFIPLLTMRLYLLWRIAIFPPVDDITRPEFNLYRLASFGNANSFNWTLYLIATMVILTIAVCCWEKWLSGRIRIPAIGLTWQKIFFWILVIVCVVAAAASKYVLHITWMNIVLPVLVFFTCEYLCVKGLPVWYRIVNGLAMLFAMFLGDPGYAIMFLIFECVYYIILSVVYRYNSALNYEEERAARNVVLVFGVTVCLITIFSPWIVGIMFDSSRFLGTVLPVQNVVFTIVGVMLTLVILWVVREIVSRTALYCMILGGVVITVLLAIGGPVVMNQNGHFKYRSLVHTKNVGEIMTTEDISTRDSRRLLEASQNLWFLQYHDNLGDDRIWEDGIMRPQQHFRKGVSWSTQVSDVICSRYIVAELSSLVPVMLVLLVFVLLYLVLRQRNYSSTGKTIAVGIALLLLIQTTFVWMANTNRMIFFGQDLPFMSHNAHVTLIMFALLVAALMFALGNETEDSSVAGDSITDGFDKFRGTPLTVFTIMFIAVFGIVYFTGNHYSTVYKGSRAEQFNVGTAMDRAEGDLQLINNLLAKLDAQKALKQAFGRKKKYLIEGDDLTKIVELMEGNDIKLTEYVEKLYDNGGENSKIDKFTYSLYNSFVKNYSKSNKISNIIHLRYSAANNSFSLALNNGFYSLKAPEMVKTKWWGNVYGYEEPDAPERVSDRIDMDNVDVFRIPDKWLIVDGEEKAEPKAVVLIRDNSGTMRKPESFLHDGQRKIKASESPTFFMTGKDIVSSVCNGKTYVRRIGGNQENLLAKNMIINGQNRFFYPLGNKLFWIKNFCDYAASDSVARGDEPCRLTIDKSLEKVVHRLCGTSNFICSVVALDGLGNVRVLVDNNVHPNPNNENEIEKSVENRYLNPNYQEEIRTFGNLNLVPMNPGPGSSMKPITYAAVTSQTSVINDWNWSTLKLHTPTVKPEGSYYLLDRYGAFRYTEKPFKSIASDERGDGQWVNSHFYLSRSSNYYNALVTYIGNYTAEELENWKQQVLVSAQENSYPVIEMNGQRYAFNDKAPIYSRKNSNVLINGLSKNFKLLTNSNDVPIPAHKFLSQWYGKAVENYPWVFPSQSTAYLGAFQELDPARALVQYTLGADPLHVSPLMMAEMYGRLFSLHPDYHATMVENKQPFQEKWNSNMFQFYQQNLFPGMNSCVISGTAGTYLEPIQKAFPNCHFYAKTGTLNDSEGNEDRLLAVVITNKDVTKVKTPDDYRFYVLYFRFVDAGRLWDTEIIKNVIRELVKSASFKEYMNHTNNKNNKNNKTDNA